MISVSGSGEDQPDRDHVAQQRHCQERIRGTRGHLGFVKSGFP